MLVVFRQVKSIGFSVTMTERAKVHTGYTGLTTSEEERCGVSSKQGRMRVAMGRQGYFAGSPNRRAAGAVTYLTQQDMSYQ